MEVSSVYVRELAEGSEVHHVPIASSTYPLSPSQWRRGEGHNPVPPDIRHYPPAAAAGHVPTVITDHHHHHQHYTVTFLIK
jgi:hypothetical protein